MNQTTPPDPTDPADFSPGLRVPVPPLPGSRREQRRLASSTAGSARSGLPPVPLSVWLSAPLIGCCRRCEEPTSAACANRLPSVMARQVVDAYSRTGDIVFVPDAGNAALLLAAVQGGRKVLGLVRGSDQGRRTQEHLNQHAPQAAGLAMVRSAPNPGDLAAQGGRIAERAALAVVAPHDPVTPRDLALLLDAAHRALRPGGGLAITSRQSPGRNSAGNLTAHAQGAGFTYLQHIAAVEATATGDTLRPPARSADHGPDCTCPSGANNPVSAVTHNDLLVFTRP